MTVTNFLPKTLKNVKTNVLVSITAMLSNSMLIKKNVILLKASGHLDLLKNVNESQYTYHTESIFQYTFYDIAIYYVKSCFLHLIGKLGNLFDVFSCHIGSKDLWLCYSLWWHLEPLVRLVWLFHDLWSGHSG